MTRFVALVALLVATPLHAASTRRWAPFIAEASQRFGVPAPWIERVIVQESAGRTTMRGAPIRSNKGAMGLMQLMPGTWIEMRNRHGLGSNPDDPRANILAGTAYLRMMYDRFGYPGLFAAYNAGPARYSAYLAGAQRLPRETVAYVGSVAGALPLANVAVPRIAQGLFLLKDSGQILSSTHGLDTASRSLFVINNRAPDAPIAGE